MPGEPRIVPPSGVDGKGNTTSDEGAQPGSKAGQTLEEQFSALSPPDEPGKPPNKKWTPAINLQTTAERVNAIYDKNAIRPDIPPLYTNPHEMRIGAAKFFVPPVNVNVHQTFRAGSLGGGALRQPNSPKFNTGHSETVIEMTLYFPTHETVWGTGGDEFAGIANNFEINFDEGAGKNYHTNEHEVDNFLSSLRGFIAQFKYAPFLPVKNIYLNKVHNITGVAMKSLSISTVDGFPNCLRADVTMYKFNHKVYLPMIESFDQAIHWGKFRQYMGRASARMEAITNRKFLEDVVLPNGTVVVAGPTDSNGNKIGTVEPPFWKAEDILGSMELENLDPVQKFHKGENILDGHLFDLYYPYQAPTRIDLPKLDDFQPPVWETSTKGKAVWQTLLGHLGIDVTTERSASFDEAKQKAEELGGIKNIHKDYTLVNEYTQNVLKGVENMGIPQFNEYYNIRLKELPPNASQSTRDGLKHHLRQIWFAVMYRRLFQSPALASALAYQDLRRNSIVVQEWEVPMVKLGLSSEELAPYVHVAGVSVSMGNNLARLQVQMQSEPVHQHIGGLDTVASISLIVFGESPLLRIRQMFEAVQGISRLEKGHGVLGFLGIKNSITALVGMKYCIPLSFNVDTIPNYPHVYNVTFELTDFDVFQQKREQLNNEQQAELIDAFGKANPFLRIKQLWGVFTAYPDFPLSVRDKDGKLVGSLDPDFYFKAYKGLDDDIVESGKPLDVIRDEKSPKVEEVAKQVVDELFGKRSERKADREKRAAAGLTGQLKQRGVVCMLGQDEQKRENAISIDDNGISLWNGADPVLQDARFEEMHAGNVIHEPAVAGLTPPSRYVKPYYDGSSNPKSQYGAMMRDSQYRNKNGRMVRAFPSYMLWLVSEGGMALGVKMFDDFFGLQSVIDFSINQSEDIMGDTLVLRLSNLYSRLSTEFADVIDEKLYKSARMFNTINNRNRKIMTGLTDYMIKLDSIQIKPGVRVHMRVGYGSDPNAMDIVFNGVVTQVEMGEILTVTCQSDAIELGAFVNTDNSKGDSGKIDGALTGFYMSEPRDLMLNLLTMGSSVFKEFIASASAGQILSENRFGIRHFGKMLYSPLSEDEAKKNAARRDHIAKEVENIAAKDVTIGTPIGFVSSTLMDVSRMAYSNLARRRDYEVFKRNIYPGNGTGIGQYVGGDLGETGLELLLQPTGVNPDGTIRKVDAVGNATGPLGEDPKKILADATAAARRNKTARGGITEEESQQLALERSQTQSRMHTFAQILGIQSRTEDDVEGGDEVSFRAQTYMKTVWDLMLLCAGLLPNYIVAVRPFEERSTVFYGKPHWTYTSGLIPLTTGIGPDNEPELEKLDPDDSRVMAFVDEKGQDLPSADDETREDFYNRLNYKISNQLNPASSPSPDPTAPTPSTGSAAGAGTGQAGGGQASGGGNTTNAAQEGAPPGLPSSGVLSGAQMASIVYARGLRGETAAIAIAVAKAESGWKVDAIGQNKDKHKSKDHGLWQINDYWHRGKHDFARTTRDPWYNSEAMMTISGGGKNWKPWYGYQSKSGAMPHKKFLDESRKAVAAYEASRAGGAPATPQPGAKQPGDSIIDGAVKGFIVGGPVGAIAGAVIDQNSKPSGPYVPPDPTTWNKGGGDPARYAMDEGWRDEAIPVIWDNSKDEAGIAARQVFEKQRTDEQAEEIWDEFRRYFQDEDLVRKIFNRTQPELDPMLPLENIEIVPPGGTSRAGIKNPDPINPMEIKPSTSTKTPEIYNKLIDNFKKFMWSHPYHRGWLVLTADRRTDFLNVASDPAAILASGLPGVGILIGGFGLAKSAKNNKTGRKWDFHEAHRVWEIYLTEGLEPAATHMKEHYPAGKDHSGLIPRLIEEFQHRLIQPVVEIYDKLRLLVSGIYTALTGFMQVTLAQLSHGMSMASNMQRRSNMLNRMFNDSIYYAAGEPGTLLFLADNPFTREYGEPVVEIRQPFQRVHYLSSFQNILGNSITENGQVPTVVTALSNGKHPVTVHFNKGAAPEYQREVSAETGLYWDQPNGWFGLQKIIHPFQAARQIRKGIHGESDEMSSKRVALWHLKEHLKDLYGGELIILGDASIRPHDLVYLGDVYERMYGFFEVEAVTHHFTPETGFITSIVPNALVTIQDPARWSLISWMNQRYSLGKLREKIRHDLKVRADNSGKLADTTTNTNPIQGVNPNQSTLVTASGSSAYTLEELAHGLEDQLTESAQYSGGVGAIVTDMSTAIGTGSLIGSGGAIGALGGALLLGGIAPSAAGGIGLGAVIGDKIWGAWKYIRDNLLDQHGCYIQYLTHKGQPMDGNLTGNESVAVGQQHGLSMLLFGLNLGHLSTRNDLTKQSTITTSELLSQIGYTRLEIEEVSSFNDMFTKDLFTELQKLSQRNAGGYPFVKNLVIWAEVTGVRDGDTIFVKHLEGDSLPNNQLRFFMCDAPEDHFSTKKDGVATDAYTPEAELHASDPGVIATRYTMERLPPGTKVALRMLPTNPKDIFGRSLAFIFHNAPNGLSADERKKYLLAAAGGFPDIDWQMYNPDGLPYTMNQELLDTNHAQIEVTDLGRSLIGNGVIGSGSK